MSYFSATLDRILQDRCITQSELARLASVNQSLLSRYINAEGRPNLAILSQLTEALGEDGPALVAAYLRDDTPSSVRHLIDITVREDGPTVAEQPPAPPSYDHLPPRERKLLGELAELFEKNPQAYAAIQSIVSLIKGS